MAPARSLNASQPRRWRAKHLLNCDAEVRTKYLCAQQLLRWLADQQHAVRPHFVRLRVNLHRRQVVVEHHVSLLDRAAALHRHQRLGQAQFLDGWPRRMAAEGSASLRYWRADRTSVPGRTARHLFKSTAPKPKMAVVPRVETTFEQGVGIGLVRRPESSKGRDQTATCMWCQTPLKTRNTSAPSATPSPARRSAARRPPSPRRSARRSPSSAGSC